MLSAGRRAHRRESDGPKERSALLMASCGVGGRVRGSGCWKGGRGMGEVEMWGV